MAKSRSARLSSRVLNQDREIARAVLGFDDYQPANQDFTPGRIQKALEALEEAEAAEDEAQRAATRAREKAVRLENEFHDLILGTKRQVVAQYGEDSDEIAALGLKKKSERRYGRPKKNREDE